MVINIYGFVKKIFLIEVILFSLVQNAYAVKISPIVVDINLEKKIVSLEFTNDTGRDINIQSSALSWNQTDGADKYVPTNDLVIVPAIVAIPAGKVQVFRVSKRSLDKAPIENAYRIYLQDVSPDFVDPNNPTGVAFKFNQDLPAFYYSQKQVFDKKLFRATTCKAADSKQTCIRVENLGNFRLSLRGVKAKSLTAKVEDDFDVGISGTVLAKSWKEFQFTTPQVSFKDLEINTTIGSILIPKP